WKGRAGDAHDEAERVAAGATTEAVEEPSLRIDVERGCLLAVKRAQPDEAPTARLERDVLRDQRDQVGAALDLVKQRLWDHGHRLLPASGRFCRGVALSRVDVARTDVFDTGAATDTRSAATAGGSFHA